MLPGRVAALDHVGPLALDVVGAVHAQADDVLARHVRRVAGPLAQQVVRELLLDRGASRGGEEAPRGGELLDADDVAAARRARLVPQAVDRREHVRPPRVPAQVDLGLVAHGQVVEVLRAPVQARL